MCGRQTALYRSEASSLVLRQTQHLDWKGEERRGNEKVMFFDIKTIKRTAILSKLSQVALPAKRLIAEQFS